MPVLLVSACLLGQPCRYNARGCLDEEVVRLCRLPGVKCLQACPEILGGLPTPRPPAEIAGGTGYDVLSGLARVMTVDGHDVTAAFVRGASLTWELAKNGGATMVLFKDRSPSCGKNRVYNGTFRGFLRPGPGVTSAYLQSHGLPLFSEKEAPVLIRLLLNATASD